MKSKKILILGATGMLGNTLFSYLSKNKNLELWATVRSVEKARKWFTKQQQETIVTFEDAQNISDFKKILSTIKPDCVVNCIGIVKQAPVEKNVIAQIYVNALFPHMLAKECTKQNVRLIHISSDCVFNGEKGMYQEKDLSDAYDVYGKTKWLGEVNGKHCVTIRTSIIGHGLENRYSLIDWFLTQKHSVKGFTRAIYSGLPTIELARIIEKYFVENKMEGVYHVSSDPISKYDLLCLVSKMYNKHIAIEPDPSVKIDRSLDSTKFRKETGYQPPTWKVLIKNMYNNYKENKHFVSYE